jgi:hypothetical protein
MKKLILGTIVLSLFGGAIAQAEDAPDGKKKKLEEFMLKRYDKNGDGKLDDEEKAAMKKDREEQLKKYDKNGNGKLDDDEKAALREDLKKKVEGKKKQAE